MQVTNATLSLDARSRESIYFALVSSSTQHRTEKMVCEWSSAGYLYCIKVAGRETPAEMDGIEATCDDCGKPR
ncbi:hypothetical protein P8C59_006278 [Phyllachora maydis]|uniref:Uncharacterized protein n=1 Tax=Phyllachora maydis TaxID=1825666 RepID=A0AAD9I6F2_9PEZI|nr:hypothetical protein P8C59_006278 [Phyllachora maydis]